MSLDIDKGYSVAFANLPREMIFAIFSFLSKNDLETAGLVCMMWNDIGEIRTVRK